jgi:hypothetical protein
MVAASMLSSECPRRFTGSAAIKYVVASSGSGASAIVISTCRISELTFETESFWMLITVGACLFLFYFSWLLRTRSLRSRPDDHTLFRQGSCRTSNIISIASNERWRDDEVLLEATNRHSRWQGRSMSRLRTTPTSMPPRNQRVLDLQTPGTLTNRLHFGTGHIGKRQEQVCGGFLVLSDDMAIADQPPICTA